MSIQPQSAGRCPHCKLAVRFEIVHVNLGGGAGGPLGQITFQSPSQHALVAVVASCPACGEIIMTAIHRSKPGEQGEPLENMLWPDTGARPVPQEVESEDANLAGDFREAVAVFPKSKKASAALSRRCLQRVLTTKGGATSRDLSTQIDEVLKTLPTDLSLNVDAIRQVGNFAAHPIKSTSTGEIVDVEDGEAEWLLEVLEQLFDHYYVAPAGAAAKRAALNAKLAGLGKPPLKT